MNGESRVALTLIILLLLVPTVLVAINLPTVFSKKPPRNFWKDPIKKLKGGNPYARMVALSGSLLMIVAQFYSVVKRSGLVWMRRLGGLKTWLNIHIILDFIGPALVLIHAGLFSEAKFTDMGWLLHNFRNFTAGIPAILAPAIIISGIIGRYLYNRLPMMQKWFKWWRIAHLAFTAIFYVFGIIHILINTEGFKHVFEAED